MILKDIITVADSHGDDSTSCLFSHLQTAFFKWKKFLSMIPGPFRVNTHGNTGLHLFHTGQNGFQPLTDIGTIQEQAVKTSHPGRQQWDFFQIILRNKAGQIRTSAVSRHHIKIASVISHIENRFALRYVLFSDNSQMRTGFPENQFEYSLYDAQGGNISCTGIELSNDPFYDQNRDGQNQKQYKRQCYDDQSYHNDFLSVFINFQLLL